MNNNMLVVIAAVACMLVVSKQVLKQVLGIPMAKQVRPGQVRILIVSAPRHDWSVEHICII